MAPTVPAAGQSFHYKAEASDKFHIIAVAPGNQKSGLTKCPTVQPLELLQRIELKHRPLQALEDDIPRYLPSLYIKQSKCYKSGFNPVKNQTSDTMYELQAPVGTDYITAALVSGVLLGMASTQKELLGADKLQIIRLHLSDFESSSINAILPGRVLSNRISHLAIRICKMLNSSAQ